MTIEEYIKNPMGGNTSVISNRQLYHNMYTEKWNTIKVRENGNILYYLYRIKNDYYIHIKIPSEIVPKFYYDTIIRFYLPKNKLSLASDKSLSEYETQFYSNDPSFVYTFAHAFKEHDMLIADLEYKMSKLSLKERAKEKNPGDNIGYVKSLYFAYLEIKTQNLLVKAKWAGIERPYSKHVWDNTVEHADDKVRKRQEEGLAISKKEKRKNNSEKNIAKSESDSRSAVNKSSPNIPNFGHFKKSTPTFVNIDKSFGHFKKNKNK